MLKFYSRPGRFGLAREALAENLRHMNRIPESHLNTSIVSTPIDLHRNRRLPQLHHHIAVCYCELPL